MCDYFLNHLFSTFCFPSISYNYGVMLITIYMNNINICIPQEMAEYLYFLNYLEQILL